MNKQRMIATPGELEAWLESSPPRPSAAFQQLDLRTYESRLLNTSLQGCGFFGCVLASNLVKAAHAAGCVIYSEDPHFPFKQFRTSLYSPDELFEGFDLNDKNSYKATKDWQIYLSFADPQTRRPLPTGLNEVLARRIHDNCISLAIEEKINRAKDRAVAIMGGHDTRRSEPSYRAVALLAHALTKEGYLIVSGGGPGIMEAANLGAFLANTDASKIDWAIEILKAGDTFSDEQWLTAGWKVCQDTLAAGIEPAESIGIPTWFYGHEPPNPFATHIAKYFENSIREEGLLAVGLGGIIFAAGNAGTVQEIFQDACQNYYRTYGSATAGLLSPMVLLDKTYWDPVENSTVPKSKPVYPLLKALAREKNFEDYLLLTDPIRDGMVREICNFLKTHPPMSR